MHNIFCLAVFLFSLPCFIHINYGIVAALRRCSYALCDAWDCFGLSGIALRATRIPYPGNIHVPAKQYVLSRRSKEIRVSDTAHSSLQEFFVLISEKASQNFPNWEKIFLQLEKKISPTGQFFLLLSLQAKRAKNHQRKYGIHMVNPVFPFYVGKMKRLGYLFVCPWHS